MARSPRGREGCPELRWDVPHRPAMHPGLRVGVSHTREFYRMHETAGAGTYIRSITAASKCEYFRQMLAGLEVRARKIAQAQAGLSVRNCVWVGDCDGAGEQAERAALTRCQPPHPATGACDVCDVCTTARSSREGQRERSSCGVAHSSRRC